MRFIGIIFMLFIDIYLLTAVMSLHLKTAKKYFYRSLTACYIAISILLTIGIYIGLPFISGKWFYPSFFIVVFSKLCTLPFLLADDFRRLIQKIKRRLTSKPTVAAQTKEADAISRSAFLVKAGALVAAVPLSTLSWSIISGAYDYRVRHQTVFLPNLPKAFDGITIGQISDIHAGSFIKKTAVSGGVDLLLAEKPDAIFFTGDLVNYSAREMNNYISLFSRVKAPLGVYSVLGNHDYGDADFDPISYQPESNHEHLIQIHKLMGWDLLLNENRRLKVDGEEIAILGSENWGLYHPQKRGNMELTSKGAEDAPVRLLLSHDPSYWKAMVLPGYPQIDMMFSGHTHGMQFGVRTEHFQYSPIQTKYPEWAGLYKHGQQQLYVNVGYGFLAFPGRLGILPEITIFTLKTGKDGVKS